MLTLIQFVKTFILYIYYNFIIFAQVNIFIICSNINLQLDDKSEQKQAGSVGSRCNWPSDVAGRSDGADAGGQSRQDGHGSGPAGSRGRRQRPGRRGLHGADVCQRARPRGDRQAAAGSTRLWRHAQRQRE